MTQVHGHEVMRLMLESGAGYTRESLRAAILERFGTDARFHTCSAQGMDADGIIEFLAARGKFVEGDGGFTTEPGKICNHEEH